MKLLLKKEIRLASSPLTWFFIAFGLMMFLPGYPVLCGAFFICLGVFQSIRNAVEANDIVFSLLLPVAKRDAVRGKYLFAVLIEMCGFILMAAAVLVRMTLLKDAAPYRSNALMNANPFALGAALLIFALFNSVFIGGFFKTAYRYTKPFIFFAAASFLLIGIAEALHRFPGLSELNAFGFDCLPLQLSLLAGGGVLYTLITLLSCRRACESFERIDF